MRYLSLFLLVGAISGGLLPAASAAPARFWLSSSSVSPGLELPLIPSVQNSPRYLHIWVQPGTVNPLQEFSQTNPFKVLQTFALNLRTNPKQDQSTSVVDFIDGTYTVYNPTINNQKRFQFVFDSTTPPVPLGGPLVSTRSSTQIAQGQFDELNGLQGFSIATNGVAGVGGAACNPSDPYCANTSNGSPAWLLASVAYQSAVPTGSAAPYLQIGANGMIYQGETDQVPEIVFGINDSPTLPAYNSRVPSSREFTHPNDTADASITARSPTEVVPSQWTGGTGSWASNQWSAGAPPTFVTNATLPNTLANHVVTVSGKQVANSTTVNGGTLRIGSDSSLASAVTVGNTGAIGGPGWVDASLALNAGAALAVEGGAPLKVAGSANIAGAGLRLAAGFAGVAGSPIEILRAHGGIQGSLSTTPNQPLGGGLLLHSVTANSSGTSLMLQVAGIAGDYNANGVVDAADYTVWRDTQNSQGTNLPADGDHDGVIDADDYIVWRANFGKTAPVLAAAATAIANNVPEPTSLVSLGLGLLLSAAVRRRGI